MKCMAVVAVEQGKVRLVESEILDPKDDEVQVRLQASVISPGTERAFILGLDNAKPDYPFVPGYCIAGKVEKTGQHVSEFKPGDRVACFGNGVGHRTIGNVSQKYTVHIPDGVSYENAAFMALGQTALQGIRKARIEVGESVMVLGLGLVGQMSVQLASINGALPVVGVDRVESRLNIALESGADMVIDSSIPNYKEELLEKLGGNAPSVVIESTGYPDPINLALDAVKNYGRVSLVGCTRGLSTVNFYEHVCKKSISVIGAHAIDGIPEYESHPGYWTYKDDANCFLRLIQSRGLTFDHFITNKVSWQDAEEVYEKILSWDNSTLGVLFNWD